MSSSKKKRPLIQKCRFCDCFFLAKDIDEHQIGRQTPKGPKATQTEGEESHCDPSNFAESQFAMIKAHFGLTLRQFSKSQATDSANCVQNLFPVPLYGWIRHNSALVHPETLSVAGLRPKSAVLRLSTNGKRTNKLLSLWPSAEVPPMRILLPNSMRDDSSPFVRLAILHASSVQISKMSLQPNLSLSELPSELWAKLAQLSHFQLFIRSYFCDSFICEHFDELSFFYYGRRLFFRITDKEFEDETDKNTMKGEVVEADGKKQNDKIHRISPMCAFDIRWDEVLENKRKEEEEDAPDDLC